LKLLLDEMISWRIAAQLRSRGHDVVAVERDRPELEQSLDPIVLAAAAAERRAVVTNNVRDYRLAHERVLARGENHYGVVYTYDETLPRNKDSIALWVSKLSGFLDARPADDALLNRMHLLL
jgi:predicted nuclease of predicted toxin-antitoxin system